MGFSTFNEIFLLFQKKGSIILEAYFVVAYKTYKFKLSHIPGKIPPYNFLP